MKAVAWEPPAIQEFDDALAASHDAAEFQRAVNEALDNIANGRVTHARDHRPGAS